jgi:hypothetical protein
MRCIVCAMLCAAELSRSIVLLSPAQFYQPMPCIIWVAIAVELALSIKYGEAWPDFGVLMGLQFINGTVSL